MEEIINKLVKEAIEASEMAYAPYSNFRVGAALLTENNHIIKGCNVENSSYGLTVCAERNAVFSAITQGYKNFSAIAIYTNTDSFTYPCGACRQVLAEFVTKGFKVYSVNKNHEIQEKTLEELLPFTFTIKNI